MAFEQGESAFMLLQTNSYLVPKEKRAEHARLVQRFRHVMQRLGCEGFEVYEQVGPQWGGGETSGRFVQIMRFTDRRSQQQVRRAERDDAAAQELIGEFCRLIDYEYQQQQGLFVSGYYTGVLSKGSMLGSPARAVEEPDGADAGRVESIDEPSGEPSGERSGERSGEPAGGPR